MKEERTLFVIDAGIASEENLSLLRQKEYNYRCVFRTHLKDYRLSDSYDAVIVKDTHKQNITLRRVHSEPDGDHYLEITSPSKSMTEPTME